MMEEEHIKLIPKVLQTLKLNCLDLTGGAPELHPQFRSLVQEARDLGVQVIDRCNLTILQEPGQEEGRRKRRTQRQKNRQKQRER